MKGLIKFILPAIAALGILSCSGTAGKYETFTGYAQGGVYSVRANMHGVHTPPQEIAETIDSLLAGIDFSISGYNHGSLLSRRNAGEQITPDRHFSALLELSRKYGEMTDGAFDVYSGPLFDIWGFGFTADSLPSDERIEQAMRDSRAGKILNFNAIAQGYSCDVVASYLYSIGVEDMLVDIGEIYCDGVNPSGEGWKIGIDNPVDGNNTPGKDLRAVWSSGGKACGIVTSGNYRKFYVKDGRKYAHTIDPRTGRPVTHNLLSATIVAPTAAEADAIATACMVMGPGKARAFIEEHEGLEAFLVSDDGVWASEGFTLLEEK